MINCPADQSSRGRRLSLEGRSLSSTREIFLSVFERFSETQTLRPIYLSFPSGTTPTKTRQSDCTTTCIQRNGGGAHRSESIVLRSQPNINIVTEAGREGQPRSDHYPDSPFLRQNPVDHVWEQDGIPSLYDDWQHPERDTSEAVSASLCSPCLPSNLLTWAYKKQSSAASYLGEPISQVPVLHH